jgi:hypothetical protein
MCEDVVQQPHELFPVSHALVHGRAEHCSDGIRIRVDGLARFRRNEQAVAPETDPKSPAWPARLAVTHQVKRLGIRPVDQGLCDKTIALLPGMLAQYVVPPGPPVEGEPSPLTPVWEMVVDAALSRLSRVAGDDRELAAVDGGQAHGGWGEERLRDDRRSDGLVPDKALHKPRGHFGKRGRFPGRLLRQRTDWSALYLHLRLEPQPCTSQY